MAFYDDFRVDEDAFRSPIWGTFELVKGNVESLVALNLAWALQLLPAFLGIAFWMWPLWLRILLLFCSASVLAVGTGALYGIIAKVCRQEPVTMELVREQLGALALPGLQRLAPLYGVLGFCLVLVALDVYVPVFLQVLVQFISVWLVVCSLYWGPLFAEHPQASVLFLLKRSLQLVWQAPVSTIKTGLLILVVLGIGLVSIGGLFLIAPVVITILQTYRYQQVAAQWQKKHAIREGETVVL